MVMNRHQNLIFKQLLNLINNLMNLLILLNQIFRNFLNFGENYQKNKFN